MVKSTNKKEKIWEEEQGKVNYKMTQHEGQDTFLPRELVFMSLDTRTCVLSRTNNRYFRPSLRRTNRRCKTV